MRVSPNVVPTTIRVERTLDRPPAEVFDAYADIDRRVEWIAGPYEELVFESHEFRPRGTDRFLRRLPGGLSLAGSIRYEHIGRDESIVYLERLQHSGGDPVTVSIVSWAIAPAEHATLVVLTAQITSVLGSRPIEGSQYHYNLMLDRLRGHLTGDRVVGGG